MQKKSPVSQKQDFSVLHHVLGLLLFGKNGNKGFVVCFSFEFNHSVGGGKQRVILSHGNIFSREVYGAALPDNDVAGNSFLTAEYFYSETLAM